MEPIKFVPKQCISRPPIPMVPATETTDAKPGKPGYEPAYTGFVMLRMPDYDTVQSLYEGIEIEIREGESAEDVQNRLLTDNATRKKSTSAVNKAVRQLLPSHIESLRFVRTEDGFVIDQWDHLRHETEAFGIITEIVTKFLGSNRLGKSDPL